MDTSIFKAYDIRGIYPEQINRDVCYKIGRAFAIFIKDFYKIQKPKIVIGYDIRKSSKELFKGTIRGLAEEGCNVIDMGLCSTPMNYFADWHLKVDGAVMITASHNPKEYNGLKLSLREVTAVSEVGGAEFIKEKAIADLAAASAKPGTIAQRDLLDDYLGFLVGQTEGIDFSGIKIAVDCGNGMAGPIFKKLAERLGLDYQGLFMEPDGDFPNHEPNPLNPEAIKKLQKLMAEEKFALGVIFDGDGDRIMVLDSQGNPIKNDFLFGVLALYYLEKISNKKIVCDARLSRGVREAIKESGGQPLKSKVGYPNLRKVMREENVFLGGELSGHFFWQDFSFSESALLTLSRLLVILKKKNEPIEKLIEPLKRYFGSGEINFEIANKEEKMEEVKNNYQDGEISFLDGLTVEYRDWWFNLRPSNTEPVLRLTMEAKTEQLFQEQLEKLKTLITT